jgi:hypothetical protein
MPHISSAFFLPMFPVGAHSSYDMLEFGVKSYQQIRGKLVALADVNRTSTTNT